MVPIHEAAVFSACAALGLLTVISPLSLTMLPPPKLLSHSTASQVRPS